MRADKIRVFFKPLSGQEWRMAIRKTVKRPRKSRDPEREPEGHLHSVELIAFRAHIKKDGLKETTFRS